MTDIYKGYCALLRKLNVAVTGSGLRAWLRGRYAWLPVAVR